MLPVSLLIGLMILTWAAAIVATYMESSDDTESEATAHEVKKHRAA